MPTDEMDATDTPTDLLTDATDAKDAPTDLLMDTKNATDLRTDATVTAAQKVKNISLTK